ncbi:MAG: hypothetical protein E6Q83_03500 [Thiothrix sp.]|nr:MAG: hypothetical protein E6Q83_03500 [Thiothrix sp.]
MSAGYIIATVEDLFSKTEINSSTDLPTTSTINARVIYQINNDVTVPTGRPDAGKSFKKGDFLLWDADKNDGTGVGEYIILNNSPRFINTPSNYALAANLVSNVVPATYDGYRDYDGSYATPITLPPLTVGSSIGKFFSIIHNASFNLVVNTTNTSMTAALTMTTALRYAIFVWDGGRWVYLK